MSRSHQKEHFISGAFTPMCRARWKIVLSWGKKVPQFWLAGRIANRAPYNCEMLCRASIVFPRSINPAHRRRRRAVCFLKQFWQNQDIIGAVEWWGGVGASGDLRRGRDPGKATEASSVAFTRAGDGAQRHGTPAEHKETQDYKEMKDYNNKVTTGRAVNGTSAWMLCSATDLFSRTASTDGVGGRSNGRFSGQRWRPRRR